MRHNGLLTGLALAAPTFIGLVLDTIAVGVAVGVVATVLVAAATRDEPAPDPDQQ